MAGNYIPSWFTQGRKEIDIVWEVAARKAAFGFYGNIVGVDKWVNCGISEAVDMIIGRGRK